MTTAIRRTWLISLLPIALLATRALGDPPTAPASDAALHRAVVGTWLYEQNAGVASVAMFTTYREDGTAIQLIKTKFVFQKASGVWIENHWKIQNGVLLLTPVRYRAHSSGAEIDLKESHRQLARVDGREMLYLVNGKERKEDKIAGLPDDVQKMIAELSRN